MKFKVMFNFLMYSDRTGTDKNHPRQNPPDKNPREQLRENLYKGGFVRVCCTGGSEICDVLSGGSQDFWSIFTPHGG